MLKGFKPDLLTPAERTLLVFLDSFPNVDRVRIWDAFEPFCSKTLDRIASHAIRRVCITSGNHMNELVHLDGSPAEQTDRRAYCAHCHWRN